MFRSLLPKSKGNILVNLHIDFEFQKNYEPGYPIVKRGIYYGSRKLSAQLDNNENDADLIEVVIVRLGREMNEEKGLVDCMEYFPVIRKEYKI